MPTPTDYSKCEIYKIICNDPKVDFLYVGHTTNWTKRKSKHKECCSKETHKEYNTHKYQLMRENGGWENFKMIFIEKYPCESNREAEAREQELMDELRANMNTNRAFGLDVEQCKKYQKEYYEKKLEADPDYIKKRNEKKNNKPFECECGSNVRWGDKARHFRTKKHQAFKI